MAMRKSIRRELRKLRELVVVLLQGRVCFFCREPLLEVPDGHKHGNSDGPVFREGITEHHVDGDHDNNAAKNRRLCHTSCHKSYHARQRRRAAKSAKFLPKRR